MGSQVSNTAPLNATYKDSFKLTLISPIPIPISLQPHSNHPQLHRMKLIKACVTCKCRLESGSERAKQHTLYHNLYHKGGDKKKASTGSRVFKFLKKKKAEKP